MGIDRLVAIFAGEDSIREVIAFPKTQSGSDPMTGAPKPVAPGVLGRPRAPARPAARTERPGHVAADDLFSGAADERLSARAPLAARLRPRTLDEIVGQQHLVGPGAPLRALIESDRLDLGHPVGAAGHRQDHPGLGGGHGHGQATSSRCRR